MLSDFIHSSGSNITKRGNQTNDKNAPATPTQEKKRSDLDKEKSLSSNNSPTYAKQARDLTDQIKGKIQEWVIGTYENVPNFLRDNEFIHSGYRINFSTPKMIFKSLFMIHNESVNIWSHLAGAIALIIICVALCFSVTSIDTEKFQNFVQTEVKELFEPIYDQLPNFSKLEFDLSKTITQTTNNIVEMSGGAIINIEHKLQSLSNDIVQAKENLTPEAVGRLLTNLKSQLDTVSNSINVMASSMAHSLDKEKLEEMSNDLKNNLNDLQDEFINSIDSSKYDWIDIYKYLNPNTPSLTRKKGMHLVPLSRWPIIVFLISAVFCLSCSAVFHAFYCLNERAFNIFKRLDYAGISILITGSCFPAFVYGFYCEPFFSKLYLSLVGTTSIVVFFVSLGEFIHKEENIHLKAYMYGGLGAFAGLPIFHLAYLTWTMSEDNGNLNFTTSIVYYLLMGLSYLGGLAIYSTKFPERFKPGGFDIWGHSHQIWHVCVLLGIVLTYFGAFDNYYARLEIPCIGCEL